MVGSRFFIVPVLFLLNGGLFARNSSQGINRIADFVNNPSTATFRKLPIINIVTGVQDAYYEYQKEQSKKKSQGQIETVTNTWWIHRGSQPSGPYSTSQMKDMLRKGEISGFTSVSKFSSGPFSVFQDYYQNEINVNDELLSLKWYYVDENNQWQGPVSAQTLVTEYLFSRINETTFVKKKIDGSPVEFSLQPEFSLLGITWGRNPKACVGQPIVN